MPEQQVAPTRPTIAPEELYDALAHAWTTVIGGHATHDALLVLMAQSAFETTGWKSAINYNLGGIKHTPGDGHDYYVANCTEVIGGQTLHLQCPFRSYASLEDAAADYLNLLHKHFSASWPAVLAGDPTEFVHQIKIHGYFTAKESDYLGGVMHYYRQFAQAVPSDTTPANAVSAPTKSSGHGFLLALEFIVVGAGAYYVATNWKKLSHPLKIMYGAGVAQGGYKLANAIGLL